MLAAKCQPFCLSLNVLMGIGDLVIFRPFDFKTLSSWQIIVNHKHANFPYCCCAFCKLPNLWWFSLPMFSFYWTPSPVLSGIWQYFWLYTAFILRKDPCQLSVIMAVAVIQTIAEKQCQSANTSTARTGHRCVTGSEQYTAITNVPSYMHVYSHLHATGKL